MTSIDGYGLQEIEKQRVSAIIDLALKSMLEDSMNLVVKGMKEDLERRRDANVDGDPDVTQFLKEREVALGTWRKQYGNRADRFGWEAQKGIMAAVSTTSAGARRTAAWCVQPPRVGLGRTRGRAEWRVH